MSPLKRTLIEKAGHDNGFEHVLAEDSASVTLASARHRAQVIVSLRPFEDYFGVLFLPASPALLPELQRVFSAAVTGGSTEFRVTTLADLAMLLRRAGSLSQALPSQASQDYQALVVQVMDQLPPGIVGTEVERLVRQRVGQDRFRAAMLDYWGSACAVTGVAVSEVLRASHAKPWAECDSDGERLDVFNGFLLSAHLDALFDSFLISFDDAGSLMISDRLTPEILQPLGLHSEMRLRWLTDMHRPYLEYHRDCFRKAG